MSLLVGDNLKVITKLQLFWRILQIVKVKEDQCLTQGSQQWELNLLTLL